MSNPERTPLSGQEILTIKERIWSAWEQLPPEHQATTALVLVGSVSEGEYGEWLMGALMMLYGPAESETRVYPLQPVLQALLRLGGMSEEERGQLDAEDLRLISSRVVQQQDQDALMQELEEAARRRLEEKRANPSDQPDK